MSEVEQKNCCPVVISKDQIIPGTEFYDMWNVGSAPDYKAQVPIFSVYNMHGLNAIIGYVMLINSNTCCCLLQTHFRNMKQRNILAYIQIPE